MLVARFEQNTVKEIEVSAKRFEQSGVVIKGCILNGVIKRLVAIMATAITIMGIAILKINE